VLYQQNGDRIVTIDSVTSLRQRRKRPSYRAIYSSIMQGVPERVPKRHYWNCSLWRWMAGCRACARVNAVQQLVSAITSSEQLRLCATRSTCVRTCVRVNCAINWQREFRPRIVLAVVLADMWFIWPVVGIPVMANWLKYSYNLVKLNRRNFSWKNFPV